MKKLNELFDVKEDIAIESIEEDSRVKADNYLFCAIEGLTVDGHNYIKQAVENGAVAILARKDVEASVPVIKVNDTNKAMSLALSKFYDNVDKQLKLIGVTGTDGKTTLSHIIYQLLNVLDNAAYIGTNGLECKKYHRDQKFTTPFPKELYKYLSDFYDAGCNYVSIETTSERLLANRLSELNFEVAIFTNLSRDHLNTHKTMENYLLAKAKLFELVKDTGFSIINSDDKYAKEVIKRARGKVITYGIDSDANVTAKDIMVTADQLTFTLIDNDNEYYIDSPLSGKFNVYNLMAAFITCTRLGYTPKMVIDAIKLLKPISSRQTYVDCNQPYKVMIDYAHTANALRNLLEYINITNRGRVIIVTGSGGLRDKGRRVEIGEAVTELADHVIFTLEDPRTEDVNDIIDDMVSTIKDKRFNYERVLDREAAIFKALSIADEGDIVLITGKGDEDYQEINNQYVPYKTDYKVVEEYFKKEKLRCR